MNKKICIVVSSPRTISSFWLNHIQVLSASFDVSIVMDCSLISSEKYPDNIRIINIAILRKVSLLKDIKAWINLVYHFRKEKYCLVISQTPKAGFLAMSAAKVAGIPIKIHIFTGQVWVTRKGMIKYGLKIIDQITAYNATHILLDSLSQKEFLLKEGVIKKGDLFGPGSISGVDISKYKNDRNKRKKFRDQYGIKENDIVFIFVGRLNRDKGVIELAHAFKTIFDIYDNVKLIIIGKDEENLSKYINDTLSAAKGKYLNLGFVNAPQEIMVGCDVICLPSHREGFGSVLIEAAAMKLPAVASNIYGIKDAVIDHETGLLHEVKNIDELVDKLIWLVQNPEFIKIYGEKAQIRARCEFSSENISLKLKEYVTNHV